MESREERRARLRRASKASAARADEETAEDLALISDASATKLRALMPKVSDPDLVKQLIKAINESTEANESKAKLRERIEALGRGAWKAVKEVADILRG